MKDVKKDSSLPLLVIVIQMTTVVVANIVTPIVILVGEIPNTNVSFVLKDSLLNQILMLLAEVLAQMDIGEMPITEPVSLVTTHVPPVPDPEMPETVHLVSTDILFTTVPVMIHVQLECGMLGEIVLHVTSCVKPVTEVYGSIVIPAQMEPT